MRMVIELDLDPDFWRVDAANTLRSLAERLSAVFLDQGQMQFKFQVPANLTDPYKGNKVVGTLKFVGSD